MTSFDAFADRYDNFLQRLVCRGAYRWVIKSFLPHLGSVKNVLEVGCGTGSFLLALRERFPSLKLHGVDPSEKMLAHARLKLPDVDLRQAGGEALPYDDSSFDLVAIIETLHHIPEQEAALREAQRALRPGGLLVVLDPILDRPTWRFVLRGAKRWTMMERHSKFFYATALLQLIKQSGFTVISTDRRLGSIVVVARK